MSIPDIFSDVLPALCEDRKAETVAATYGWWQVSTCPPVLVCASPAGAAYTVTVLPEVTRCTCPAYWRRNQGASDTGQPCKHLLAAGILADWDALPPYTPEAVADWLASLQPEAVPPAVRSEEARTVQAIENVRAERDAAGGVLADFTRDPGPWAPPAPLRATLLPLKPETPVQPQSHRQQQAAYEAAIRDLRRAEAAGATGERLREAQAAVDAFCSAVGGNGVPAQEVAADDW